MKDGVVAILDDGAGRYLFIRRGLTLERSPGWWCFVGGQVEPGETLEAAAAREVFEEVGLRVRVHGLLHDSLSAGGEFKLHWFATTLDPAAQVLVPCPVEVDEVRWLTPADGLRLHPLLPGLKSWLEEQAARG
ncbi:MAG TPA: NUDIX hydrolase [Planctomycetota bacterium]|nr:NUDIX hydrolase [Planctomycetota bacterium]